MAFGVPGSTVPPKHGNDLLTQVVLSSLLQREMTIHSHVQKPRV